jgi:hypothetical protein
MKPPRTEEQSLKNFCAGQPIQLEFTEDREVRLLTGEFSLSFEPQ